MEERKDGARMIGMRPHLLLSSSPSTLAPQGKTPISGQQLMGTGSLLLLTPLLLHRGTSQGSLGDSFWRHEGDPLEEGSLGIPDLLVFLPPSAGGSG